MSVTHVTEHEFAALVKRRDRDYVDVRGGVVGHTPLQGADDGPVPNETGNRRRNPRMARNKDQAPVALRGKSVDSLPSAGRGQAYSPEVGLAMQLRTKESARRTNAGSNPAPSPFHYTLALTGQLPSGKNQVQLLWRNGKVHKYPNVTFTNWRAKAHGQILGQHWGSRTMITTPVCLTCEYWPGDQRTRDVSGLLDALFHVLVYAKVLKDDGLIWSVVWRRHATTKFPKVVMDVEPWI